MGEKKVNQGAQSAGTKAKEDAAPVLDADDGVTWKVLSRYSVQPLCASIR